MPSGFTYAAFISYRHLPRDAEVAQRVQKAIETYRLPRGIAVEQEDSASNATHLKRPRAGKTLGKCFRDEDELAASPSLPDSIQEALARSHSLVVICSPETQESAWVRREIEAFVALHGRERIICVLAAGSPEESIPPILKTRMMPDTNGVMREMPAEPLAADLRPEAKAKRKAELLRIIAAVAGCSYDDLRRRERARKRKRIALASAVAALAISAIATFAFQFHRTSEAALIAESKNLAAQALDQYAHGEHLQAIETAVRALPTSETDQSRPLVPEAQAALEKVLGLNPDPNQPWVPLYILDTKNDIVNTVYNRDGGWIAILDSTGTVSIYDAHTSSLITSGVPDPFKNNGQVTPEGGWFIKSLSPSALFVGNRSTTGGVGVYDPLSGRNLWGHSSTYALTASPIADSDKFGLLAYGTTSLAAAILETETGDFVSGAEATVTQFPRSMYFDTFCLNDDLSTAYFALRNSLVAFDLKTGTRQQVLASEMPIQSVRPSDDKLLLVSSNFEEGNVDSNHIPFSVCALDINALDEEPLWTFRDTYSATISSKPAELTPYNGFPQIHSILHYEQDIAIVTAGKKLLVVDLENGDVIYSHESSSSIVDASPCFEDESRYAISLALSNGQFNIVSPLFEVTNNSDDCTTDIPYAIDGAILGEDEYGNVIVFFRTPDQQSRLFCYMYKPYYGEESVEEFSLNELLSYAHEALEYL